MKDYRSSLNDLSAVLRRLHKTLLDTEAENFGPISGPYQLLSLTANHEHFAWLRRFAGIGLNGFACFVFMAASLLLRCRLHSR